MALNPSEIEIVAIDRGDRWQAYRRLQELGISCTCFTGQPLQAQIHTPTAAIQLWSVVRQMRTPRCQLARWLEQCLQAETTKTYGCGV